MKIELRDPSDLHEHKILRSIPLLDKDSQSFAAFCDSVHDAGGIIEPIKITKRNEIVDGRHRWRAAKRLQLAEVPCIVIADEQIVETAMTTLLHRRHFTKGQRAYLSAPLLAPAFEESRSRRLNRVRAQLAPLSQAGMTLDAYASHLGISDRLMRQARELHRIFDERPTVREEFEPKILDEDEPLGLGHCIAGIAGQTATKDVAKVNPSQLELFNDTFTVLGKRLGYWMKFDEAQKANARDSMRKTVAAMPADLREALKKSIAQVEREEKA